MRLVLGDGLDLDIHRFALRRVHLDAGCRHQFLHLVVLVMGHVIVVGVMAQHEGRLLIRIDHVIGPVIGGDIELAIHFHLPG